MNRRATTVLFGGAVLGIILLLAVYMGLIVTGVIDTRPGDLVIVAQSAQKEYDGKPLSCPEAEIRSGSLKKGHKLEISSDSSLTDAGTCENKIEVKIRDSMGADVTNHYNVETKPGTLTVTPRKLVLRSGSTQKMYDGMPLDYGFWEIVSGEVPSDCQVNSVFSSSLTYPGQEKNAFAVTVTDSFGRDVSQNFSLSYIYGTLTVTKRPLTVTSYGATKVYDGLPLTYENCTIDGELLPEHYLWVEYPASITNVGSVTNNIIVNITSWGKDGEDYTRYYDVTVKVGTLTVTPRPIQVTASPAIKNYTGTDLPVGEAYLTGGSLVAGHRLNATVEAVKNDMNTVEYIIRDVKIEAGSPTHYETENYQITLVHGIDRDQMLDLTVASGSKSAPYTGQALICEQYMLSAGTLAQGHEMSVDFTGSQTEIGTSPNTFTVTIVDSATGEDVTYRYNVQYQYGTLEVYETSPSAGGEIIDDGGISQGGAQNQSAVAARIWAESGGKVYLRWKSYGDYVLDEQSGRWEWSDAMAYPLAPVNMLYTVGQALAADGKVPVLYNVELLGNQYLLPNYAAEGPSGEVNDVVLAPTSLAYTMSGYLWTYSYTDALRYAAPGLEGEMMQAYTAFVSGQYLAVPESTKQALLALAEQNGLRVDRLSIIEDVAAYIRASATYDTNFTPCPQGEDEVVYFLTESKSGVCRHFASAATLMYRALGIPARYVVGYTVYAAGNDWTDVTGADAHAWVEVFIPGLGWVRIDPTPAANTEVTEDSLVLGLTKVLGYYTGLPYRASEENVVVLSDVLKPGHTIASVKVKGERTEAGVGVSTIEAVTILDENGNDVTAEYEDDWVLQDGVIEVKKPTLIVTAASNKKIYDGIEMTAPSYTYTFVNTQLSDLYQVTATVTGAQTEVGQSSNEIGDVRITEKIFDTDITDNFVIERVSGTLKVYRYELSVSSPSATKPYDGQPLIADRLTYDARALDDLGHRLVYTMPQITNAGSIYNTPTCTVLDAYGNDVTKEYDILVSSGVLRVERVALTVLTDSAQKVYDGTPLTVHDFAIMQGTLVPGQTIDSWQIKGSQTNVGVSEVNVTGIVIRDGQGRDVSANYLITVLPGTLMVTAP